MDGNRQICNALQKNLPSVAIAVDRPLPSAFDEDINITNEHGQIGSGFV